MYRSDQPALSAITDPDRNQPYSYLLVDLKPDTPEANRLRDPIHKNPSEPIREPNLNIPIRDIPVEYIESDSSLESKTSLDMPVCDDCGIIFGDVHSLQNHVKR